MLEKAGVTLLPHRGRIVGPNAVEVAGETYTAERILIAVGARPSLPDLPGLELAITSDDALEGLTDQPGHLVVVGGGYIGVELATLFQALGVTTTLVIRRTEPLRGFDRDVRAAVTEEMRRRGLDIRSSTTVASETLSAMSVPRDTRYGRANSPMRNGSTMFAIKPIAEAEKIGRIACGRRVARSSSSRQRWQRTYSA